MALEEGAHPLLRREGEEGIRDDEAEAAALAQQRKAERGEVDVEIIEPAVAPLQRRAPGLGAAGLRGDVGRVAEDGVEARVGARRAVVALLFRLVVA